MKKFNDGLPVQKFFLLNYLSVFELQITEY